MKYRKIRQWLKPANYDKKVMLLLGLLFSAALYSLWYQNIFNQNAVLEISLKSDTRSILQVFWANEGQRFTEQRSARTLINKKRSLYQLQLGHLNRIARLRIDPSKKPSNIVIKSIQIKQTGYQPIILDTLKELRTLIPVNDIQKTVETQNGLMVFSTGPDPQLFQNIRPDPIPHFVAIGILKLFAIFLSLLMLSNLIIKKIETHHSACLNRDLFKCKVMIPWCLISLAVSAFIIVVVPLQIPGIFRTSIFLAHTVSIAVLVFILSFFLAAQSIPGKQVTPTRRGAWLLYALPAYIAWAIYLLAFWPAAMSPDSISQWEQAMTGRFTDWHPAFHTMNIWLITRFWHSPAAVALVQIVALGSVAGWGLASLRRYNVPELMIWVAGLFFALLPVNGLMGVTLWKDFAYATSILSLTIIILQIVMTNGDWLKKRASWPMLGLVIGLVTLYRHNGFVAAFGTSVILLFFYRKFWGRILMAMILSTVMVTGIRGPLYDFLHVERGGPKIIEMLPSILKNKIIPERITQEDLAHLSDVSFSKPNFFVRLKIALKPRLQIWRIKRSNQYFVRAEFVPLLRLPNHQIRYITANALNASPEELGLIQASIFPSVKNFLFRVYRKSLQQPFYYYFIWSPGFYLFLFFASLAIAGVRVHSWKVLIISTPILFHALPFTIIRTLVFEFRYYYPIVMTGALLSLPILFVNTRIKK